MPELNIFTKKIGIRKKEDRRKKIPRSIERPNDTVKNHFTIIKKETKLYLPQK